MKIFFHGFWEDFYTKKDKVNYQFFLTLFATTFRTPMEFGSIEDSDILIESIFSYDTCLYDKQWKYTIFFSGESDRRLWNSIMPGTTRFQTLKDYTCILKGEKSHANIVNIPLFVVYSYCFGFINKFIHPIERIMRVPQKNVCVIVTNGVDGEGRNTFFDKLEKRVHIDYAGWYKNNVPRIEHSHCSPEFIEFVSQYKFIISMENSKNETYITEKILHGFCANTIPVYWGSDYITDYFNEDRFINVKNYEDATMDAAIERIVNIINNDDAFLEMVNQPIYKNNQIPFTIESISKEIRNVLQI